MWCWSECSEFRWNMSNSVSSCFYSPYPLENDDPLLVVFVGGDVKHGSSVPRYDRVLHLCVFPDVQVVSFDSTDCRPHRGRFRDSQMKETWEKKKRSLVLFIIITWHGKGDEEPFTSSVLYAPVPPPRAVSSTHRQEDYTPFPKPAL